MYIKSLEIEYQGELLISDIDDCLIYTTKSLKSYGFEKRDFWFDEGIYEENKQKVFENAKLTPWGKEFSELKTDINYLLLTAAPNRKEIILNRFNIESCKLTESMSDTEKIYYINNIKEKCFYIDDKQRVLNEIINEKVTTIHFPPRSRFINKVKRRV